MFFYVAFFYLILFSERRLLSLTLILGLLIICLATVFYALVGNVTLFGNNTFATWLFYIFPGFRILEFLVGMLLYNAWSKGVVLKSWAGPLSYVGIIGFMLFAEYVPESFRFSLYFLPIISLFLYAHLPVEGYLNDFYSSKLLVLLGNASFSFYLLHQPLIRVFEILLERFSMSDAAFGLAALLGITLISVLAYWIYEKPVERLLKSIIVK